MSSVPKVQQNRPRAAKFPFYKSHMDLKNEYFSLNMQYHLLQRTNAKKNKGKKPAMCPPLQCRCVMKRVEKSPTVPCPCLRQEGGNPNLC